MRRLKFRPIRIVKYFIAVFLLVVLVLIAKNFISRSFKRPKYFQIEGKITQQKVENKEGVRHLEYKKGRLKLQITTEKYYKGSDDLYHLEGNSEIVFMKTAEDHDIIFSGMEIIHDEDLKHFLLRGDSKVKYKDLVVDSSFFEYEAEEDVLKSDSGVRFVSERFDGSAAEIVCWVKKERITLQKNIELRMFMNQDPSTPLLAYGDELDYAHKKGLGTLTGHVQLFYGESKTAADELMFDLMSNKESIKALYLKGNIQATLITEQGTDIEEGEGSLLAPAEKREIRADEMSIRNYQDPLQVRRLQAKGHCRFLMEYTSGRTAEIQAESMECILNRKGELRKFKAVKNVEMVEKGKNEDEERLIHAETLIIERQRSLEIKGGKKTKAKIVSGDFMISSQHIRLALESENVVSKGGVSVVFGPRGDHQKAVAFFSKEQQVFIKADEMRYLAEKKRFFFKENIKVWQGKDMLLTTELTLFLDTGKILCSQGARSMLAVKPKEEKEEEKIEIYAEDMGYNPDQAQIYYDKNCILSVRDISLQAKSIFLDMAKEKSDMELIRARGDIVIKQNKYEARGQEAVYDIKKETITLTGQPVLMDKDKGKSEGDKLTFNLADGRIIVENKDRKRSKTAIKS